MVALLVFSVAVALSFAVDEEFESRTLLEITDGEEGSPERGPARIEEQLGRILEGSEWLRNLGAGLVSPEGLLSTEEVRAAIDVSARSPRTYEASFRSATPELAQRGCRKLGAAIVAHFGAAAAPGADASSATERQALTTLDQKTRALADFVVQHPNLMLEGSGPAPSKGSTASRAARAPADSTLTVLRQERARLEAEIAKAEAESASAVVRDNPYDDAPSRPDTEALKRKLTEVRGAFSARQRALTREPTSKDPAPVPASSGNSLVDEWKRLVQAVSEAQKGAPAARADSLLVARIVEEASLPTHPATLRRASMALGGGFLGLVLGIVYVVARTRKSGLGAGASAAAEAARPRAAARSEPAASIERSPLVLAPGPSPERPAAMSMALADTMAALPAAAPAGSGHGEYPAKTDTPPPTRPLGGMGGAMMEVRSPVPQHPAMLSAAEGAARRLGSSPDLGIPRPPPVPTFARGPTGTQVGMLDPSHAWAPTGRESAGALEPRRIVALKGPEAAGQARSSVPQHAGASQQKGTSSAPPRVSPLPPAPQAAEPPRPPPSPPPPPPGQRPSRPPRPPLSPPPPPRSTFPAEEGPPITARLGSSEGPRDPGGAIDRAIAIRRSETEYSFVDRRQRSPSRRAEAGMSRPGRPSEAPAEQTPFDASRRISERPPAAIPELPSLGGPSGHAAQRPEDTAQGWVPPSSPPPAPHQSTAIVRVSQRASDDDFIEPHSVPPSWEIAPEISAEETGEIRALRDRLLALPRSGCCVVGVASGEDASAGKSEVAARLAAALSAEGRAKVLLMETNFDYPAVHQVLELDIPQVSGFSQQMRSRIRSGTPRPWVVVQCTPHLHALPEGVLRSPGILLTREFAQAVQELRRSYDFIVADGPVVGQGNEHKALDAVIDTLVLAVAPSEPLEAAMDRSSRWFSRKDLVAAVPTRAAS